MLDTPKVKEPSLDMPRKAASGHCNADDATPRVLNYVPGLVSCRMFLTISLCEAAKNEIQTAV